MNTLFFVSIIGRDSIKFKHNLASLQAGKKEIPYKPVSTILLFWNSAYFAKVNYLMLTL